MDRRRFLRSIVVLAGVVGIAFVSVPFIMSMTPADHLPENFTEIEVSGIRTNSLKMVAIKESKKVNKDNSTIYYYGEALLVVRGESNDYYAYWLPTWENKVLMPRRFWGQHDGYCSELKIRKAKNQSTIIYCKDPSWEDFVTRQWLWSIDGKNLGEDFPDLVSVRHRISAGVMHAFYR